MADRRERRTTTAVYGNLAYDLDTLVRQRDLEQAGRIEEQEREREVKPRRQSAAQPRTRLSPLVVGSVVLLAAMVLALVMGHMHLTTVSAGVAEAKEELAALNEDHVSLVTRYEQTFDLATVKEAAQAAGMSKPTAGQIEYVDLSGEDEAVVYRAGTEGLLGSAADEITRLFAAAVEYFR